MHYVYVLLSLKDKNLYVGYTINLKQRLNSHMKGAILSTKNRQPLQTLVGQVEDYQKLFANRVIVILCAGGWPDATQAFNDSAASLTDRGARVFIK